MRNATTADLAVMGALELALDYAYHDGNMRDLAVAAEAWTLAGYNDGSLDVTHASMRDLQDAVRDARSGRHRRLLRADARGMLTAFRALAESGAITYATCAEANRQRWLARGGHDHAGVIP